MDRQVAAGNRGSSCRAAFAIVLASCGSTDLPCRLAAGTDVLECMELDVASPVTFDRVDIFAATHSIAMPTGATTTVGPIVTPQIEAGATPPASYLIYARAATPAHDVDSTTTWHGELASPIDGWQKEVAIVASANGTVVALGGIRLNLQSTITDGLEDIWYGGSLTLVAPPANLEIWGSSGGVACARVVLDQTFYFTREGDLDCDGMPDTLDSQPLRF